MIIAHIGIRLTLKVLKEEIQANILKNITFVQICITKNFIQFIFT